MEYDFVDATIALVMSPLDANDDELRGIIAMSSGVPYDRLEKCLEETKQALPQIRMLVQMAQLMNGGQSLTVRDLQEMFAGSTWIDDDKGQITINTTVCDEEGEEIASSTARSKLH